MFLGEPPRSQGDLSFSLAGFFVRVTPWFWLATVLLGIRREDPRAVLVWVAAVFVSILIHELGHAFAFRYYGQDAEIVLYHFGGLAISTGNRSNRQSKYQQIIISAAGPALQMGVAVLMMLGIKASGNGIPLGGFVADWLGISGFYKAPNPFVGNFVYDFLYISVYWALLNLLPIYPLDGGQIARELFLFYDRHQAIKNSLILSMVCGGAMAFYGLVTGEGYLGIMFGMLAYSNYMTLQSYTGHGGGFGRGW